MTTRRTTPDHHDAELLLKVYDLRRETLMRESRLKMIRFVPKSFDEFKEVAMSFDHPLNAAMRQVGSYWEMVYGMAHHGIVHAEYWMENNGEGMNLFAKVSPYLPQLRAEWSPLAYQHAEWAATQTETGRRIFGAMSARLKKMLDAAK